jgi:UDP-N-acetylglucosamine:LPS N-acetylglucosamine transferase
MSESPTKSSPTPEPLKVLFLSSDTGGGHRASAESLAAQFQILYPGTTYDLLDVVTKSNIPPYNKIVESYKHLSAHPQQWNLVFKFSNSRAFEFFFDVSNKMLSEKAMRKSIMSYNPDVVVSVHPMMTNVPVLCCQKISKESGRHLPIFTVVTDLASAHCLWFANGVDKLYIASDECRRLAKERGKVPDEKIVEIGLPIRHQFAVQADLLGDRKSPEGVAYQIQIRKELELPPEAVEKKTVLVMGGGEGVGSLSNIVDALYFEFHNRGIDALILVVCGRNEKLKEGLENRDWDQVVLNLHEQKMKNSRSSLGLTSFSFQNCVSANENKQITDVTSIGCMEGSVTQQIKRILSSSSLGGKITSTNALSDLDNSSEVATDTSMGGAVPNANDAPSVNTRNSTQGASSLPPMVEVDDMDDEADISNDKVNNNSNSDGEESTPSANLDTVEIPESINNRKGDVTVVGLGFVTKMAEYMVVADVLVSKAGPGTIAEAASLSLPVMLTSFLPGQEEGNVDFVVDGGFGKFIEDKNPPGIAEQVADWLLDDEKSKELSIAAKKCGAPNAARDIVKSIGDISLRWKKINDDREKLNAAAERLKLGIQSKDDDDVVDAAKT